MKIRISKTRLLFGVWLNPSPWVLGITLEKCGLSIRLSRLVLVFFWKWRIDAKQ